jgi:hypothetical protein
LLNHARGRYRASDAAATADTQVKAFAAATFMEGLDAVLSGVQVGHVPTVQVRIRNGRRTACHWYAMCFDQIAALRGGRGFDKLRANDAYVSDTAALADPVTESVEFDDSAMSDVMSRLRVGGATQYRYISPGVCIFAVFFTPPL